MSVTLVSCYYKFKSKHSFSDYISWINNFHNKIKANLIIFTNNETYQTLKKLTDRENIIYIIKELDELEIMKRYPISFWENQHLIDRPEFHGNRTKECYILWNSKFNFLKEAIDKNPFNSDKFVWCDIGSLRNDREIVNFPSYHKISTDKLDIIMINKVPRSLLKREIFFKDNIFFSGSIFGGGKEIILKMHQLFYNNFDKYSHKGLFVGCDQQIITTTYLLNHELFNPIKNSDWFYMYNYYSD